MFSEEIFCLYRFSSSDRDRLAVLAAMRAMSFWLTVAFGAVAASAAREDKMTAERMVDEYE